MAGPISVFALAADAPAPTAQSDILTKLFKRRSAQVWERSLLSLKNGCVQATTSSTEALLPYIPFGRDSRYGTKAVWPTSRDTPGQPPPPCLAGQQTDHILAAVGNNRMKSRDGIKLWL